MKATLLYLLPAVLGCKRASLEQLSDPATAAPGGLRDPSLSPGVLRDPSLRSQVLLAEADLLAERAGVPDMLDEVLAVSQGLPSSLASLGSGDLGLESIRTLTSTGNSLLKLINM